MAIGKVTNTILDPGLGLADTAGDNVCAMGCSSSGTVGTLYSFNRISDVVSTLGQGPLPEALCHMLQVAGGPVFGMRLTSQTAGACGAVTAAPLTTATGTITVAGAAADSYSLRIEITGTGTTGAGLFRYTLDGVTFSESITIPQGGTYVVPNTGLTLTFVPGAGAKYFEAGDVHTATCTAPLFDATGLAAGFTALLAQQTLFPIIVLTQREATGSAAATIAAALATQMTALENSYRYARAICDGGSGDTAANAKTAFASFSSTRVNKVFGKCTLASGKPFTGWAVMPNRTGVLPVAARAAAVGISTSLGRVASGSLPGVTAISHDEGSLASMDSAKFTTLRTYVGEAGYYITDGLLSASSTSDFQLWQYGRVMDLACKTVYDNAKTFINAGLRTAAGGILDARDAARVETRINEALKNVLLQPLNDEGFTGHVSSPTGGKFYSVDRAYNVLSNRKLQGQVAIRPLAYPSEVVTTLGFTLN